MNIFVLNVVFFSVEMCCLFKINVNLCWFHVLRERFCDAVDGYIPEKLSMYWLIFIV